MEISTQKSIIKEEKMKKFLTVFLAVVFVLGALSIGYCDVKEDITKQLDSLYFYIKSGKVDDIKKMLTIESQKKIKKADIPNVLGNLDAVLEIAQSVKDEEITISITDMKYDFQEVIDDKVIVVTTFKMQLINADSQKEINNNGKQQIVFYKEKDKWYIVDINDLIKK